MTCRWLAGQARLPRQHPGCFPNANLALSWQEAVLGPEEASFAVTAYSMTQ